MIERDGFVKVLLSMMLLLVAGSWAFPGTSQSACGAAASSCKNCHEVKGEMAVNASGDWHTQHAFGDFCVFCHSGNTAATDKAGAHKGMVKPLADLQKSCASCHPDDYEKRAQGYGAGSPAEAAAGTEAAASPAETSEIPPPTPDPSTVRAEDLVDYNLGLPEPAAEEAAEVSGQQEEAEAQVPEKQGEEKAAAGGSKAPIVVGVIVIIGVVVFMLFRKK